MWSRSLLTQGMVKARDRNNNIDGTPLAHTCVYFWVKVNVSGVLLVVNLSVQPFLEVGINLIITLQGGRRFRTG